MNTEPRSAAPGNPRSSDPSLASWRAILISRTARVLVITSGIVLAIVTASYLPRTAPAHVWAGVVSYALGVLGMWMTRRNPRLHAIVMLVPFVLIAPFLFLGVGISASAFLALAVAAVLAAILAGSRVAVGFLLGSLVAVAIGAALVMTRSGTPLAPLDPHQPLEWVRIAVLWLAMTSWIVFTVGWITARFEESLLAKDRALERLQAEEHQRFEAERRHHQAEMGLIEAQRREALGRLSSGIAHDFNNSLLVILGWNEMLKSGTLGEDRRHQGHAAIAAAGDGAAQLARHLLTIGRRQVEQHRLTRLGPLVEEAARHLKRVLPDDVRVEVQLDEVPPVVVDRSQVHQALLNLALNARDAMPRGGTLTIGLHSVQGQELGLPSGRGWVELVVGDDGTGMDSATLARVFEPYFTTKPEGRGTGLGLVTTQAIVQAAGGNIRIDSSPGKGTRVRIQLPIGAGVPTDEEDHRSPPPPVAPGTRVALIEDDEAVRQFMAVALRAAGYEVVEARDGDAGLELVKREGDSIHLLCTDAVIPGAPVEQLIEEYRRGRPDRPLLLCSGHVGSDRVRELIEHGELPLLAKPFTGTDLLTRIGELLQARGAGVSRS